MSQMTREEAICYLWDVARQCISEFCVDVPEIEKAESEFTEALATLGVTTDEAKRAVGRNHG